MNKLQLISLINAAIDGPFFMDCSAKENKYWEFMSLFGYSKDEMDKILVDVKGDNIDLICCENLFNNIVFNLIGYPHGRGHEINKWIGDWDSIKLTLRNCIECNCLFNKINLDIKLCLTCQGNIKEHDVVSVIKSLIADNEIDVSDKGVVVFKYNDDVFEIECVLIDGSSKWVKTLSRKQLHKIWGSRK